MRSTRASWDQQDRGSRLRGDALRDGAGAKSVEAATLVCSRDDQVGTQGTRV